MLRASHFDNGLELVTIVNTTRAFPESSKMGLNNVQSQIAGFVGHLPRFLMKEEGTVLLF